MKIRLKQLDPRYSCGPLAPSSIVQRTRCVRAAQVLYALAPEELKPPARERWLPALRAALRVAAALGAAENNGGRAAHQALLSRGSLVARDQVLAGGDELLRGLLRDLLGQALRAGGDELRRLLHGRLSFVLFAPPPPPPPSPATRPAPMPSRSPTSRDLLPTPSFASAAKRAQRALPGTSPARRADRLPPPSAQPRLAPGPLPQTPARKPPTAQALALSASL